MADELTDDSPYPGNGEHNGKPMKEVPSTFLDWLDGQPWLAKKHPDVKRYIQRSRKAINQDLDRGGR